MAYSLELADRIRVALRRRRHVVEMKMFGGIGFLLGGNLCCAVWKDSLILRLGPDQYEDALAEDHVHLFDITGRPMMGWVMVDPEGIVDHESLSGWLIRAYHFCRSLPPKV